MMPGLGWQWKCWGKDRLKSCLEVRIHLTYWKQDIREKVVSSPGPQKAKPEARGKVITMYLIDVSPRKWKWEKHEASKNSCAITQSAALPLAPVSRRDTNRDSESPSRYIYSAHKTPSKGCKEQTYPEVIHNREKGEGFYLTSYLLACIYQDKEP